MIGVAHQDFGEAVVAIVVPDGPGLDIEAIRLTLNGQLANFKRPKRIILVDALARNTMGKVQKKALREEYAELFMR